MSRFDSDSERDEGVVAERKQKTRKPRHYKVLLHNDDFTTTDFVVDILMHHFHKSHGEATHITHGLHRYPDEASFSPTSYTCDSSTDTYTFVTEASCDPAQTIMAACVDDVWWQGGCLDINPVRYVYDAWGAALVP